MHHCIPLFCLHFFICFVAWELWHCCGNRISYICLVWITKAIFTVAWFVFKGKFFKVKILFFTKFGCVCFFLFFRVINLKSEIIATCFFFVFLVLANIQDLFGLELAALLRRHNFARVDFLFFSHSCTLHLVGSLVFCFVTFCLS